MRIKCVPNDSHDCISFGPIVGYEAVNQRVEKYINVNHLKLYNSISVSLSLSAGE